MKQGGVGSYRRLRTALVLSLLVTAALITQPTVAEATSGGLSFGAVTWDVDPAVGTSWSVEAVVTGAKEPGAPCVAACLLTLYGARENPENGSMGSIQFLGSNLFMARTTSNSFPYVIGGTNPAALDLTHVRLELVGPGGVPKWITGFLPLPASAVIVVPGITDDLFPHLEPFLDGLDYEPVDDTVELAGDMTVVTNLATTVCTAAEEALERPGRSKGKHLGTITEADMAVATLCALLAEVAGEPVPEAVKEVLSLTLPPRGKPEGAEDVPGDGNGLDRDAGVEGEG